MLTPVSIRDDATERGSFGGRCVEQSRRLIASDLPPRAVTCPCVNWNQRTADGPLLSHAGMYPTPATLSVIPVCLSDGQPCVTGGLDCY
ncbi:unnamed protein product [Caretta caretta]